MNKLPIKDRETYNRYMRKYRAEHPEYMRDYRQQLKAKVQERLKELEKAALEKAGYKNQIKILRASISLMLSPNFQRLSTEEQLKGVRNIDEIIKSTNQDVFEIVRAEYRNAAPEIERGVDLVVTRTLKREFKVEQVPPEVEELLSRESLVGDSVKEFMRIEEHKKPKNQPGLV